MFLLNGKMTNKKVSNGVTTFDAVIAIAKNHSFLKEELLNFDVPDYIEDEEVIINYPKEAFDSESFSFLPVTRNHPHDLLSNMSDKKESLKYFGHGLTSEAKISDDGEVHTKISITNPDLLSDILNDNYQVSWGGKSKIIWLSEADAKDKGYHGYLESATGDHVAVVIDGEGRCGDDCRIKNGKKDDKKDDKLKRTNNNKRTKKMEILLNGKKFDVDEDIGKEIQNSIASLEAENASLEATNKELKEKADKHDEYIANQQRKECIALAKVVNERAIDAAENLDELTALQIANMALGKEYDNEIVALAVLNEMAERESKSGAVETVVKNGVVQRKTAHDQVEDIYADFYGEDK